MSTGITELYEESTSIIDDLGDLWEGMNEVKEWDSWDEFLANINKLAEFAKSVVSVVEDANASLGEIASSEEKKAVAVNLIDNMIALPVYLEPFDGYIIGWMIDQIVAVLNKTVWAEASTEEEGE